MATHEFDYDAFICVFPEWSGKSKETLAAFWKAATHFVAAYDNRIMSGDTLQFAVNIMTAHLLQVQKNTTDAAAEGATSAGGVLVSAGEGSVNVSYAPPNSRSAWQYWLNQTPYGQQFLALFSAVVLGGFVVNGRPETSAFRKVGGY